MRFLKQIFPTKRKQIKQSLLQDDEYESDEFKLHITGLPSDLGHKERQHVALSLFKNGLLASPDHTYEKGQKIFKGKASIKVKDKSYAVEYLIEARKVIYALQAYKAGFDIARQGAEEGTYDKELADLTADFFRDAAWQEVKNFNLKYKGKRTSDPNLPEKITSSIEKTKEDSNG